MRLGEKRSRVLEALILATWVSGGALPVFASEVHDFNVPAEAAPAAIRDFASQAKVEILVAGENVEHKRLHAVTGEHSTAQALKILLADSGLTPQFVGARAIALVGPTDRSSRQVANGSGGSQAVKEGKRRSSEGFRLAQSDRKIPSNALSMSSSDSSDGTQLQEIIVTAQKKRQNLLAVPVPVTAISAGTLVENDQLKLQDYFNTVPGLNLTTDNRGAAAPSIRGLTTSAYVTPTVGVTIDDVPVGSSVVVSSFSPIPEVDPNEIAQIEVLRGPQGTLYGASSIGGLIKFVTVSPSTSGLSGQVQVGGDSIFNASGAGYNASGSINVPLSDTLAIRANVFRHEDPGYIDNVETGQKGVNSAEAYGGLLSTLWRPSDVFTLKVLALLQRSQAEGASQVDTLGGLSGLQQSYLGDIGGYDRKIQLYSADMTARLGVAELKSITGYNTSSSIDSYDVTSALGTLAQNLYGVGGIAWKEDNQNRKFSEELRLAMPLGERIDWLLGAFYTHEHTAPDGGFVLINPSTYQDVSQAELQSIRQTYEEYAAFTDFTAHFTSRFDVQFGGREGHNDQSYNVITTGPLTAILLGAASPVIAPRADSSDSSFTYLVTPKYRFSQNFMAYARFASGYRPGGPNDTQDPHIPRSFAPDKTENYELGSKGSFLDRRVSLDASLYYIRWRQIQVGLFDPTTFVSYTGNGGTAKSQGVELSLAAAPLAGLKLSSWLTWNDAELLQALPANSSAVGEAGERLPYSSRFSGYVSLDEAFHLSGSAIGDIGGAVSYVGKREGEFVSAFAISPTRQYYGGYATIDLRAGLMINAWRVHLFVNNVGDRRGLLGGGLGTFPAFAFNIIQPRTVGLNVSRKF